MNKPTIYDKEWNHTINEDGELIVTIGNNIQIWCGDMETSWGEVHDAHEAIGHLPECVDVLLMFTEWLCNDGGEQSEDDMKEYAIEVLERMGFRYDSNDDNNNFEITFE